VADLVLLPIAQYKKDGRIVRGMQKGGKAFMKSTGMEALKLGARLATGTQVILEQTEGLLGAQFPDSLTAEAVHADTFGLDDEQEAALEDALSEEHDQYSRYSDQPLNAREGIQSAYKSLKQNLNTAAQTILAVPMEVYERSGTEVCC
jgi:autophagy-related protein 2